MITFHIDEPVSLLESGPPMGGGVRERIPRCKCLHCVAPDTKAKQVPTSLHPQLSQSKCRYLRSASPIRGAATLDAYGNMSAGQISQLLNVLGTYTEAGYNTANSKTIDKSYGFVYWVNKVGSNDARGQHLQPGVYQRVMTPFGSSLKPILIFVKPANYKQRLDFFGIVTNTINRDFASNFDDSFDQAIATAMTPTPPTAATAAHPPGRGSFHNLGA